MATPMEALRRLYSDIVWGRARVRVTAAVEPSLASDPIFVIGMYRSGTTLLRYILDSHRNLACPPESAFLSHLDEMLKDDKSKTGFASLGFDEDHVLGRMRTFAAYFFEGYSASQNKHRWVDKSPLYVDHLDFLEKLFPTARMLMIFRHPLDQVHSAIERRTIQPLELAPYMRSGEQENDWLVHSRYWADKVGKMKAFTERHSLACHQLLYEELCERPEEILRQTMKFLDEPWDEKLLRFYETEHDRGYEDGRVSATRGFSVSRGNYRAWPQDLQKRCWDIVSPTATQLGYVL